MQTEANADIGHNNPPSDLEILQNKLDEANADRLARKEELLAGVDRMPEVIEDEETAEKVTTFIKQIQAHAKDCENARKVFKEPYQKAGKAVDSFYKNNLVDPLKRAKAKAEGPLGAYLQEQQRVRAEEARAEQLRRQEEVRKQQEAAEAAELEGRKFAAEEARERQEQAEIAAAKAERNAERKVPLRSSQGGTSSTTKKWVFDITNEADIDLEALRPYLNRSVLEAAIRGFVHAGGRELPGVHIKEDVRVNVR